MALEPTGGTVEDGRVQTHRGASAWSRCAQLAQARERTQRKTDGAVALGTRQQRQDTRAVSLHALSSQLETVGVGQPGRIIYVWSGVWRGMRARCRWAQHMSGADATSMDDRSVAVWSSFRRSAGADGRGDGAACATVLTDGSPILTLATQGSINKPGGTTRIRHGHFDESSAAWSSMKTVAHRAHRGAALPMERMSRGSARLARDNHNGCRVKHYHGVSMEKLIVEYSSDTGGGALED